VNVIPYGRQSITQRDIDEVVKTLKSDFLTQGPAVSAFEQKICEYTGAKYCIAVSNGTAALHLAVLVLNISQGSEGITTPNTFVASANCMLYNQILPRFADIDSKTYNIDPTKISTLINKNTKLLVPVHFAGQVADMPSISKIAKENELFVIEDAAHAIGSQYADGTYVGNCKYSDLTTFSFHPVKTITTGEGGAITTNSKELYERLLMLRSHGITKEKNKLSMNPGPWYYEMQELGFNYRLTDLQAALGASQMSRLDEFKARRREIVAYYNESFKGISWLTVPFEAEGLSSCFHLYVLRIDFQAIGKSRANVIKQLFSKGIGTQVHYIPVNQFPYYAKMYIGALPVVQSYYRSCLSIPLYSSLSNSEVQYVVDNIRELYYEPS
jgi:UDP-4-amino-4,6-dideoxy-N-acetyl-beta-L-altrosamine transaminase